MALHRYRREVTAGPLLAPTLFSASQPPPHRDELVPGVSAPSGARRTDPLPVWSPAATDTPAVAVTGGSLEGEPAAGPRTTLRPRSGLLVALFAFYCLQLAAAVVAWREAPIRTDALVDPMVAYAICVVAVLPAFVLRGRWRVGPTLVATAAGTLAPVLLARDLMQVVGPRDVWVGQSLTLQVVFPLVVGICAVVALLTAPRQATERSSAASDRAGRHGTP